MVVFGGHGKQFWHIICYYVPLLLCTICFRMTHLLWFVLSLPCLTTNAVYLTTTPIKHKPAQLISLFKDVEHCISRENYLSPRHLYMMTFTCITRGISHCLWDDRRRHYVDQLLFSNRTTYCGIIASTHGTWKGLFKQINLIVAINHAIHLQFLTFNFEWVKHGCEEHGIVVFEISIRNRNVFCGTRLPWILLTTGLTAQIEITTIWNKNYNFRMTYSHYKSQWPMKMYNIYTHIEVMRNVIPRGRTNLNVGYDFYFLVEPDETMQIDMVHKYIETLNIIFYDGPGEKSNILFQINDSQHLNENSVLATAYLAMIRFNMWTDFTIKMIKLKDKAPFCLRNHTGNRIMTIRSTLTQAMRCAQPSRKIHIQNPASLAIEVSYPILHIDKFIFDGPLTINGESNLNCQYGGLFILESTRNKNKYICQNRQNYEIYGGRKNMLFILVWYPEYSSYWLDAYFTTSSCLGQYTTFENSLPSSRYHPFIVTDLFPCQLIICTPTHTKKRSAFCTINISGSDGPVGTAEVLVKTVDSLQQCLDFETYKANFEIKASYTKNWPFGKPRSMLISREPFGKFNYFFHYLNKMTVSLPYVCSESDPTKQLAIMIKIAMCKVTTGGILVNPINQVHSLTSECSDIRLPFTFNFESSLYFTNSSNKLDVFNKEVENKHVGTYISVLYGDCPYECRNFTYTLLIWDSDKQVIYKYTSSVGTYIFTGYFYHGLRLSVTRPFQTCGRHLTCQILYSSYKPHYDVGKSPTKQLIHRDKNTWYFNQRRYVTS